MKPVFPVPASYEWIDLILDHLSSTWRTASMSALAQSNSKQWARWVRHRSFEWNTQQNMCPLDANLVLFLPPPCFAPINICLRQRIQIFSPANSMIIGFSVILDFWTQTDRSFFRNKTSQGIWWVQGCISSPEHITVAGGGITLIGQAGPRPHLWGAASFSPLPQRQHLCVRLTAPYLLQPHAAPRCEMTTFCLSYIGHPKASFLSFHLVKQL